jgi:hypothetical protein
MSFVSADLTDGLKSYWKFDETTGNLLDSISTNDINIFSAGITKGVSGKINNAVYSGTGAREYMYGSANTDINSIVGDLSISFWIKTAFSQGYLFIIKSTGSSNNEQISAITIGLDGSNTVISLGEPLTFGNCSTSSDCAFAMNGIVNDLNNNTWQHIVFTRKKSATDTDLKIYKNGTEVSYAFRKNRNQDQAASNLVRTEFLGLDYYDGTTKANLDEFGIWNRELSQEEITQLYNSGNGISYPFMTFNSTISNPQSILYTNNAYNFLGTFIDLDYNSETTYKYSFGYNNTNSFNGSEIYIDTNQNLDYAQTESKAFNLNKTFDNTDVDEDLYSFFTVHKYINGVYDKNITGWSSTTFNIIQAEIILNIYDENTLLPISTARITDSNGTTYDTNATGYVNLGQLSGDKSFTISKTGYDSRKLDFFFKVSDYYDWNFALTQAGNSESIGFIVKDSNDNLWTNKYLMFKTTDGNIINSILTSSSGTATASILANGDYDALLYDATGTLVDTYEKTTVTVKKPKNEVTLADISPYDITVGGLLGYSLTNQSASSVSFNIFAGTQGFYYFSVVDYNAVPADRKYLPRQYFTQVPMGTGYSEALTYQPYLLLETDAVVPKITVLDQLNKPIGDVDIFISRSINNVQTIVESGKTTSTGNMSFSAYPLEYYYINVIYNGVDKGTFRVQPRESTDNFIIVIDTSDDVVDTGEFIITADFSGTPKVVNIDDTNINADITITQSLNQATSYNLYLIQNNVTKASTSGAISGLVTSIDYDFDSSVVDRFNNNLTLKLVVNYPDGNQTFYYTITATKNTKGLMYFAPQIINDIGQPLGIILAILITAMILAGLTFSGLSINPIAITMLGILILGIFMFLGWLDVGVTVMGFDIARFFFVLMAGGMVYLIMRGEQYA